MEYVIVIALYLTAIIGSFMIHPALGAIVTLWLLSKG